MVKKFALTVLGMEEMNFSRPRCITIGPYLGVPAFPNLTSGPELIWIRTVLNHIGGGQEALTGFEDSDPN